MRPVLLLVVCIVVGNRRFRITIDNHLDKYMEVKSRQQKSKIVTTIVDGIKKSAGEEGGGFVRKVSDSTVHTVSTLEPRTANEWIVSHLAVLTLVQLQDLLTRRWFRVSDKLAREKVGQVSATTF